MSKPPLNPNPGLNKVFLIGCIGPDPYTTVTAGGRTLTKISLATPNRRKVDGQWEDAPDWHRLIAWSDEAKYLEKHARSGDRLAIEGCLRPHKYNDSAGRPQHEVNIVIEKICWLSRDGAGGPVPEPPSMSERQDDDTPNP